VNAFELPYRIRYVTPDLLADDLEAQRLVLPDNTRQALQNGSLGRSFDFLVAESLDEARTPLGQVGLYWYGPVGKESRKMLELRDGQYIPEVVGLEVPPAYQRMGLGRMLAKTALVEADANEHSRLCLRVAADNERARRIYQSLRFTDVGSVGVQTHWTQNARGGHDAVDKDTILMIHTLRLARPRRHARRWPRQLPPPR
jgi:GNAT superfamily N-acetyltransferase